MATAAVQLPERLRFLPLFLALWLLTFFGPHLFAIVADLFLLVVRVAGSPMAADIGMWVVWVGLVPVAYAWAQWLLMRRCISTAVAWGLAVFIGQVLARLGTALIDDIDPRQSELTFQVFMALADALGAKLGLSALSAVTSGLCFGVATSVAQALVLPASGLWRAVWVAVMLPTQYASAFLDEAIHRSFELMYDPLSDGIWVRLLALNFVPRVSAWLLTGVVSGLLMYVVLRRGSGRVGDQLYTRFD
jgi:hypothetical protein